MGKMAQLEVEVKNYQSELSMTKEDNASISTVIQEQEDRCKCLEAENSELKTKLESKFLEMEEHVKESRQQQIDKEATITKLQVQVNELEKVLNDEKEKHINAMDK